MKILILEDEQRNAKRLIRLLNDIDRTFIVEGPLASIKETVEFFQSGKTTDLILADIRLTDGLSFEALKHAQATVPIIFTTAYDEYAVQAFKFNSFDYLLKPLDPDELEHQLNPDYFFRANRQYIINVEHVLFLGNYFGGKLIVRLKGYPKTEIQVSKEKAQRLKEWIDR